MKKTLPDESPLPQAGVVPVRMRRLARPDAGRRRGYLPSARLRPAVASTSHPTLGTARNLMPPASGAALSAGYNKAGGLGVMPAPGAPATASRLGTYGGSARYNNLRNYSVEGGVAAVTNRWAGLLPASRHSELRPPPLALASYLRTALTILSPAV